MGDQGEHVGHRVDGQLAGGGAILGGGIVLRCRGGVGRHLHFARLFAGAVRRRICSLLGRRLRRRLHRLRMGAGFGAAGVRRLLLRGRGIDALHDFARQGGAELAVAGVAAAGWALRRAVGVHARGKVGKRGSLHFWVCQRL
ncbi:hypothetical protein [Ramlibacter sp.]